MRANIHKTWAKNRQVYVRTEKRLLACLKNVVVAQLAPRTLAELAEHYGWKSLDVAETRRRAEMILIEQMQCRDPSQGPAGWRRHGLRGSHGTLFVPWAFSNPRHYNLRHGKHAVASFGKRAGGRVRANPAAQ